jgi:hypothetical protein
MANKDLFKQAIADAKSIREAAITNAKLALEESLTPQLKELLAQRLAEMEEEAENQEVLAEAEVEETETMEEGDYKEEVAEAEEAEEKEEEEGEEAGEEEAEGDSEESEDEAEEDLEVEDMTVDDLKDLIRDILSQEMGDMEAPEGEEGDEEAEDMVGMDMTAEPEAEAGEEEINLDELMAELAEMAKDEDTVEETINDPETETAHGNVAEEEETMEEGPMDKIKQLVAKMQQNAKEGKPLIDDEFFKFAEKMDILDPGTVTAGMAKSGSGKTSSIGEELAEAMETIEALRKDLNEVNLLNAKLLYVNKVFKANALTESQKATVIAAFDKAETVKEVKLVFETVSENIPSGKKEVVKEAKGFASAAVGTSDKPEVIAEANQAVLRMQKLAGIIK